MIGLKMRLHGVNEWERIAGETTTSVVVVSRNISGPSLKTNYIDINNINGVLDFSSVMGAHYMNKNVKIKLRKTANSEYDFDAFRRKFLGEKIDFIFDDEPEYWDSEYYHTGNVLSISDNYSDDFRTIELEIDSEPFKHPEAGETSATIPVYELTAVNLLTGNETLIYGTDGGTGATTVQNPNGLTTYENSGGAYVNIIYSGNPPKDFKPVLTIELPIAKTGSDKYIFQFDSADGHASIFSLYSNNSTGTAYIKDSNFDEDHIFKIEPINGHTLDKVYAILEADTQSGATFSNIWLAKNIAPAVIENGDAQTNPIFNSIRPNATGAIFIYVNGKKTEWFYGNDWYPSLILRKGNNKAFAISNSAGIGANANLKFERLVL